ncbi:MAG: hypothetical protein ACLPXB_16605 [Thiobacillaceae bacterium]
MIQWKGRTLHVPAPNWPHSSSRDLGKSPRALCYVVLAFLVGCVSTKPMVAFEGPLLPNEEVAIIGTPGFSDLLFSRPFPAILCTDGETNPKLGIQVCPGKHQVKAVIWYDVPVVFGIAKSYSSALEFEAQVGHDYVVDSDVFRDSSMMWAKQTTTNQSVIQAPAEYQGFGYCFGKCKDKA